MHGRLVIDENNRSFAELTIRAFDGQYIPIKFKFDPGADRTTISPDDLKKLGYSWKMVKSRIKLSGGGSVASGEKAKHFSIQLKINHMLNQIMPKGLEFPFLCSWQRTVKAPRPDCETCELTGELYGGFSSLLGNDILSCFDIQVVRAQKIIYLTKIDDLQERNELYYWCEMHSLEQP